MKFCQFGNSTLVVSKLCLGTMTFGEQVPKKEAHKLLDYAHERGINFIDSAEMYPVPQQSNTYGLSEEIVGEWFQKSPSRRGNIICATKIAGPSRGMPWIRNGGRIKSSDFEEACNDSLRRLQTEYVDLYQIHWPIRHVPAFGRIYFDPKLDDLHLISIEEQLKALEKLILTGKVRYIGLSNETPYGLHEFVKIAEKYNLPKIVSVQNPYCLLNRSVENALDESLYRLGLSLLAYSPLAFGLLTGKYDSLNDEADLSLINSRFGKYESFRKQRWGRVNAFRVARLYNELANKNNLTPIELAIGFCVSKWFVSSTIIGATSLAQLKENIDAAETKLSPSLMDEIDRIRLQNWDPAM